MIASNVVLGVGTVVRQPDLVNLYGCWIDDGSCIGPFVEIQKDVKVGKNCKISSHSFLCSGVTIEDYVFVGHGVMFINDIYPIAATEDGKLRRRPIGCCFATKVGSHASIGSNATILGGITIGQHALIGAGAVVTRDVPEYSIVTGVPARVVGDVRAVRPAAVGMKDCKPQHWRPALMPARGK